MRISTQAEAVLLLTAWFAKPAKGDPRPLAPTEWGRLALWLKEHGKSPEDFLTGDDPAQLLSGWVDRTITVERIRYLLERAGALGLALEKWQRAGLWIMTRSEPDYPIRLKRHLRHDAPPVLFGSGSRQLLNKGGMAVIGSREATDEDLAFTSELGGKIALQGYSVVSGGARGVDETAMLAALEKEGTVIGVLADKLLHAATSAKYRQALMDKNLVLVSPFNPEAGFDVGNAMARNKYIYCLADAAIVVATSKEKGGTWNGAVEDLKKEWVPLWVKAHPDEKSGNAALVNRGARWLPLGDFTVSSLLIQRAPSVEAKARIDLFDTPKTTSKDVSVREPALVPECTASETMAGVSDTSSDSARPASGKAQNQTVLDASTFYEIFLRRLEVITSGTPATLKQLLDKLDINKTQLSKWLKRGEVEGKIKKLSKPVRYQFVGGAQQSLRL
jgi:predicted Rossmann fold nucleotide-binding protein DprA/Smf involved in DNA uptake